MKNSKNYVAIMLFALISCVATAFSNEPVALITDNAKVVLGADYKGRISIKIPSNVVVIGDHVFEDCKYLENVTIPEGVTKIGQNAFLNCANLKSLEIPNSVNELGYGVFAGCEKLTTVVLPDGLTEMPGHIFTDCKNLKTVSIPSSVTNIGMSAFSGCRSLTVVIFEDTNNWESANSGGSVRFIEIFDDLAKNAEMVKTLPSGYWLRKKEH